MNCPACKSENVKYGQVVGQGDGAVMASLFRPEVKAAVVLSEGIPINSRFCACVECGLLWQTLPGSARQLTATYERDNALF